MDAVTAGWRTSSFSGNSGNSCVEVAFLPEGTVGVRDTKDRSRETQSYSAAQWSAFVSAVRTGQFAR
ncbi:DUF397 domain-containing protein [Pseudonocardia lacus]|jgi:hypothetical protein|uniref:DUF397 domain-containing protein n=1 Tax=Pseudonocardia lacus TaxID=2835865 RepID=UPI001BDCE4D5|nr:DUF397 domain-containing protein [Pseudonocardia lacus]